MPASLKEIEKAMNETGCPRIPLTEELYADAFTPVEIMRLAKGSHDHVFLLESAINNENRGRYSYIGFDPDYEFNLLRGQMNIKDRTGKIIQTVHTADPASVLREVVKAYRTPKMDGLPGFTGGLCGYFAYDYIRYAEPKLNLQGHDDPEFRDMDLMLFNSLIVYDHYAQKVILLTGVLKSEEKELSESYRQATERLQQMKDLLCSSQKAVFEPLRLHEEITCLYDMEDYCSKIEKARTYIKNGDIFQVVFSNPMSAKASGCLFDVYRELRCSSPSPYMFYFSGDDLEFAGASPETLVRVQDGDVFTFPLAGTRPRGNSPKEDARLKAELLADPKECAEHNMLVDLGRNDLGRICRTGTVKVTKYMDVLPFSTVMHIGSEVRGTIDSGHDALDAIGAVLPAGTLSGAPKFRACEIIEELEQSRRGLYGGAVGYIDFTGGLDLCIAIRLVYKRNGKINIRSGGGIVYDSDPRMEYLERTNKAKGVMNAVQKALGGLQ